MKRFLCCIAGTLIVFGLLMVLKPPSCARAEESQEQRLTETDALGYRVIKTKEDLLYLMNHEELWGSGMKFCLANDIDLGGCEGQKPIGNSGQHFMGDFWGRGCTIRGIRLHGSLDGLGLFGHVENAGIRDLTTEGTVISTAPAPRGAGDRKTAVGGIVGVGVNGVRIDNCVNRCRITARNVNYVGGIVGYLCADAADSGQTASIENCINESKIKGYEYSGGLLGYGAGLPIRISAGQNTGKISAQVNVGGISGCLEGSTLRPDQTVITECLNQGEVQSTSSEKEACVGGIVGNARITDVLSSMNTGRVSSIGENTGGIVGYGYTESGVQYHISGNYNAGQVSNEVETARGPIIGEGIDEGLIAENNFYSEGIANRFAAVYVPHTYFTESDFLKLCGIGGRWINTANGPQLSQQHRHSYVLEAIDDKTHSRRCAECDVETTAEPHLWNDTDKYYKTCRLCGYSDRMPYEGGYRMIKSKEALLDLMSDSRLWGEGTMYKLANDIDLEGCEGQSPIGINARGKHFRGVFDGNGYTISGIALSGSGYLGLFGYTEKAVIRNLTVEGTVKAEGNAASVGGLVGASINGITLENCVNRCEVTADAGRYVGGIIGQIYDVSADQGRAASISGCANEAAVKGYQNVGGIVGYTVTASQGGSASVNIPIRIEDCRNSAPVTADSYVGGIAGFLRDYRSGENQTWLSGCLNEGAVTATASGEKANANVGGIVGVAWISNISGSMNTGTVTSDGFRTGGIVGYGYTAGGETYAITGNYNAGSVTSTASGRKGAVIGSAASEGLTASDNYYSQGPADASGSIAVATGEIADESAFESLYAQKNLWIYTIYGPELVRFHIHTPEAERKAMPVRSDPFHHQRMCICLDPGTAVGNQGEHSWEWTDSRKTCTECSWQPELLAEWDGRTENGKRIIECAGDLIQLIENYTLWGEDANYLLTADISLDEYEMQRPIGDSGHRFKGTFDGGGHTVSGIDLSGGANLGFFGYVDGAVIRNLTLEGTVTFVPDGGASRSVGGFVGACPTSVTIQNCVNRIYIAAKDANYVGGIAGQLYTRGKSRIEDCRNEAEIAGGSYVGGIIGYIEGNGTIDDDSITVRGCDNTADVSGTQYVGGILGQSDTGKNNNNEDIFISLCRNSGNITATSYVGGIAGYLRDIGYSITKDQTTLYQCLNEGNITSTAAAGDQAYAGGITGAVAYSNIAYAMNTGRVASAGKRVGGITGSGYTASVDAKYWIAWCYNAGEIDGPAGSTCAIAGYAMDEEHGGKEGLQLENNFFSKGEGKHGNSNILHGTRIDLPEGTIADVNLFEDLLEGSHPDIWMYTTAGPELAVFHVHQAENERGLLPVKADYEHTHQRLCICLAPETAVGEQSAHTMEFVGGRRSCSGCGYKEASLTEWNGTTDSAGRSVIRTADDLQKLMANEGLWGSHDHPVSYILDADITLPDGGWQRPIGSHDKAFYGTLDGNDHTISGIRISSEGDYAGFIGYAINTTIRDLTIEGSIISTGSQSVAGLIGATPGSITLINCTNRCTVTAEGAENIGGLVGLLYAGAESRIENCANEGKITGGSNVAGIVGYIAADLSPSGRSIHIEGCRNDGEITGSDKQVGGIIGLAETGNGQTGNVPIMIRSCQNHGKITASNSTAGGIAGYLRDRGFGKADQMKLSGCLNTGVVTTTAGSSSTYSDVGGIAGSIAYASIEDCMNAGSVTGIGKRVGGIVGNCYNSGSGEYGVSFCFNKGTVSGTSGSAYSIIGYATVSGLTTENNYYTAGSEANTGRGQKVEEADVSAGESFAGLYAREDIWIYTTEGPQLKTFHTHVGSVWIPYEKDPLAMHQLCCICKEPTGELEPHQFADGSTVCTVCHLDTSNPRDSEGRYMLSSAESLLALMEKAASGDADALADSYILVKDIDLAGQSGQKPIGTNGSHAFKGSFDGGGYTVSGINISGAQNIGFFGYVNNAEIRNLTVEGTISSTGTQSVGGLIGACPSGVTIENCVNRCVVNASSAKYVGGIAGYLYVQGEVRLENCVNEAAVNGKTQVGGMAGYIDAKHKDVPISLTGCVSKGVVTGTEQNVGGIVGELDANTTLKAANEGISITECSNSGEIRGSGQIGGIIGYTQTGIKDTAGQHINMPITISLCINSGKVTASGMSVGGIVGYLKDTGYGLDNQTRLTQCFNEGEISCTKPGGSNSLSARAGGVAGGMAGAEISGSMNTGTINGTPSGQYVGGIVGYGYNAGKNTTYIISANYNAGTVTGSATHVSAVIGGASETGLDAGNNYYSAGVGLEDAHGTKVEEDDLADEANFPGLTTDIWTFTVRGPELTYFHELVCASAAKRMRVPLLDEQGGSELHIWQCICGKVLGEEEQDPRPHTYSGGNICTECRYDKSVMPMLILATPFDALDMPEDQTATPHDAAAFTDEGFRVEKGSRTSQKKKEEGDIWGREKDGV